jgi:hypothetical protein
MQGKAPLEIFTQQMHKLKRLDKQASKERKQKIDSENLIYRE